MRTEEQIFHFAFGKEASSLLVMRLGNIPLFNVGAVAGDIVLCVWARFLILTALLSLFGHCRI